MIINMKCPSCGATMQFDDTKSVMDCPYCGGQVANIAEQVNITQNVNVSGTVVHVQDRSNDPNLFITYNTNNPSVGMISRIVDTGAKGSYVNGQTLSYHLSQGPHTVVLKIGKKNYNRDIVIPPDNQPVRIYASFNGRAQISVDQPNVSVTQTSDSNGNQVQSSVSYTPPAPKAPGKPKSPLSIVAFILSLTYYLSWAGAGLGAVEVFVLDKKKDKNQIFSYLAMGIGTILTISLIFGSCSPKKETTDITTAPVAEITTTTTEATTKETAATTTTAATTAATTEADTEESEEETTEAETSKDSNAVDPDLKAYLDSYEAYMDEYIDFMVKMNDNPNDLTVLTEYTEMLLKYNEFAEAIDKYDPDTMSPADSAYYWEVINRVNKKLMDANVEMISD